jgi:hypothetical protein
MSTWALCDTCDEWFECPEWFDRAAPHPVCPGCGAKPVAIERRGGEQPDRLSGGDIVSVLHGAALTLGSAYGLIPGDPARAQQRVEAVIDTLDGVIVELRHAVQHRPATPTSAAQSSPFKMHLPDQRPTEGRRSAAERPVPAAST